jgi:hypothetical protein
LSELPATVTLPTRLAIRRGSNAVVIAHQRAQRLANEVVVAPQ